LAKLQYKHQFRNLGASEVCKTITDSNCYGDPYQWNEAKDGSYTAITPDKTNAAQRLSVQYIVSACIIS
jgi:hypothetical protein